MFDIGWRGEKELVAELDANMTKGERTRALLIDAAYEQFIANGYHGTSMRDIADGAGLAVGGIYNHFAGKEEIFEAVVLDRHPLNRGLPGLALSQGETVEALIRNAAGQFMAEMEQEPGMFNLLFIELIECGGQHIPKLVETLLPRLMKFTQRIQVAQEELCPVPPLVLAQTFVGMLFSYFVTRRLLGATPVPEEELATLDDFVDTYLWGILQAGRPDTNR